MKGMTVTRELLGGLSRQEIAAQLGTHADSVSRSARKFGLIEKVAPTTEEEQARVRLLAAEGVPSTWVAEDVHRSPSTVRKWMSVVPGSRERLAEWRSVWPGILKNPTMLALHREFAPD